MVFKKGHRYHPAGYAKESRPKVVKPLVRSVIMPTAGEISEFAGATGRVLPFPEQEFNAYCARALVLSKDYGLIPFKSLGSQTWVMDHIKAGLKDGVSSFTILKARQLGITTILFMLDLGWLQHNPGMIGAFVIHSGKAQAFFRNALKRILANTMPPEREEPADDDEALESALNWRDSQIVTENRDYLLFKNQSMLSYLVAGTRSEEAGGLGRSGSFSFAHMSEVAFYGSPDDLNQFEASLSHKHPRRLYVAESTADGYNHFYDMWNDAKKSALQRAIFASWVMNEAYSCPSGSAEYERYSPETSEPLTKYERVMIALCKRRYDIEVSPNQVAWRRWFSAEKLRGNETTLAQEMPWHEEEAFQSSGRPFFARGAITKLYRATLPMPFKAFRYVVAENWFDTQLVAVNSEQGSNLKLWAEPVEGASYVLGADPAYGSSDAAADSAASMWRVYADRVEQVAEYQCEDISTSAFAWVLAHLGGWFGSNGADVLLALEVSGPGQSVDIELETLYKLIGRGQGLQCTLLPRMKKFIYRRLDMMSGRGSAWHIKMTREIKWHIMCILKNELELGTAHAKSAAMVGELESVHVTEGRVECVQGKHDDLCVAAALALYGWKLHRQQMMITLGKTYASAHRPPAIRKTSSFAEFLAQSYIRQIDPGRLPKDV